VATPPLASQVLAALALQSASADHQVLRGAKSRQSYRRYLERALGIERGLEAMLANITFDWDVASRSKLLLLSGDLLALGASVEEILALPSCTAMQHVQDPIEAHCWLFVAERVSTAHWAAYHQLDTLSRELAASYLRTMLSGQGWDQVCGAFGRFSSDDEVVQLLIANTDKAMRGHYDWFAEQSSARIGRGSDNLVVPIEREAVLIVPPTKRIDEVGGDAPGIVNSASAQPLEAQAPPDDVVE
jgi:heme oxygenase